MTSDHPAQRWVTPPLSADYRTVEYCLELTSNRSQTRHSDLLGDTEPLPDRLPPPTTTSPVSDGLVAYTAGSVHRRVTATTRVGLSCLCFRQPRGESVSSTVGVGLTSLPAGIAGGVALGYAHFLASGVTPYLVGFAGAMVLVVCVVVAQVLGMVLRTALYQDATEDVRLELVDELGHENVFLDN